MRNRSRIIAVLMAIAFLIACAPQQLKLTPDQEKDRVYLERKLEHANAVKKFTEAEIKYNMHYEAADQETKKFLNENVDKLWIQASDALDAWETMISQGQSGEDEILAYKRLKTQILLKLPDLIWAD